MIHNMINDVEFVRVIFAFVLSNSNTHATTCFYENHNVVLLYTIKKIASPCDKTSTLISIFYRISGPTFTHLALGT